jgi:hypothetical protein
MSVVALTNGEEQSDMKRKWTTIRIDEDIEQKLSARGRFGQSYNDVIAGVLAELQEFTKKAKR